MGKGSKQRPCKVPKKQFDDNWDKIFRASVARKIKLLKKKDK